MPSKTKVGKSSIKSDPIFGSTEPKRVEYNVRKEEVIRYKSVGNKLVKIRQIV